MCFNVLGNVMAWVKQSHDLFILALLCLTVSKVMAEDQSWGSIRLYTAAMPPYQQMQGDRLVGSGVDTIRCIFNRIELKPKIELVPNSRLIYSLNEGIADGIFSLGERAGSQAMLSDPVVVEQLYWFYNQAELAHSLLDKSISVAVVRGSEAQYWLQQQGYVNITQVNEISQAIKMLSKQRVGLILADLSLTKAASEIMGLKGPAKFQSFNKISSLSVHFSTQFLDRQPLVLSRFNQNISFCNPSGFELSQQERQKVKDKVRKLKHWLETKQLAKKVQELVKNRSKLTNSEIQKLDKQWHKERNDETDFEQTLIAKVFDTKVSRLAAEVKFNFIELVSEVIITDAQGLNIGISDIPSDYWQGDEAKYLQTVARKSKKLFIDQVSYDSSSASFLSQVSYALFSDGKIIGMVMIGLNIEKALLHEPAEN